MRGSWVQVPPVAQILHGSAVTMAEWRRSVKPLQRNTVGSNPTTPTNLPTKYWEVAEWLNAADCKSAPLTGTGVRIPPSQQTLVLEVQQDRQSIKVSPGLRRLGVKQISPGLKITFTNINCGYSSVWQSACSKPVGVHGFEAHYLHKAAWMHYAVIASPIEDSKYR